MLYCQLFKCVLIFKIKVGDKKGTNRNWLKISKNELRVKCQIRRLIYFESVDGFF